MIELKEVSKRYGQKIALASTSHTFEGATTSVLIGPSGCGKSTLLRLIMGLISPTSGSILLDGAEVRNWQLARRKMGYVVQDGGLFPHLTAKQNVILMARQLGTPGERISQKVMGLCGLTKFPEDGLDRYPAELSGGQRQRVSLMRALMLDPEILLLDEPLAALDPMVRSGLQADLKDIFERLKQTVIFVTHDMAEAGFLGTSIVLLNDGKIVQRGSLSDLRERPADPFVTEFMNAQRSLVAL